MKIYHGNRSFRLNTIVTTTVSALTKKHKGFFVWKLFIYCDFFIFEVPLSTFNTISVSFVHTTFDHDYRFPQKTIGITVIA